MALPERCHKLLGLFRTSRKVLKDWVPWRAASRACHTRPFSMEIHSERTSVPSSPSDETSESSEIWLFGIQCGFPSMTQSKASVVSFFTSTSSNDSVFLNSGTRPPGQSVHESIDSQEPKVEFVVGEESLRIVWGSYNISVGFGLVKELDGPCSHSSQPSCLTPLAQLRQLHLSETVATGLEGQAVFIVRVLGLARHQVGATIELISKVSRPVLHSFELF